MQSQHTHTALAQLCVNAGADGIQYREKRAVSSQQRIHTAKVMQSICEAHGATLIINDYVDVARKIHAPAVHLGRTDESVSTARKKLPVDTLIGGTANSIEEALQVNALDVDYIGVGPIFGTKSKASPAPTLGVDTLKVICEAVEKPVVAIGNIQLGNVVELLSAGAHGIAVISAIVCASDVECATKQFCDLLSD